MAAPENQTLRILRDIRTAVKALDAKVDDNQKALETKVDRNQKDTSARLESIRQALNGESVLGRSAAAEVEERLEALEKRVAALEGRR